MFIIKKIDSPDKRSEVCNLILRSLPKWFGIEASIVDYVKDVRSMQTWAYYSNEKLAGFISLNSHNESTVEIHVIGVVEEFHQQGLGKKLIQEAEKYFIKQKYKFLTVKTLSELRADEFYEKTRLFYLAMGFSPVEVFKTLWGEHNPCLLMIKPLVSISQTISAVMVHATDCQQALQWYQKAFPQAQKISLPDFNFEYLKINEVNLEVVEADHKVGAGAMGSVVYWEVADFEKTKADLEIIGAILYRGPMDIENNRRMCQLKDPFGNLLGIRGPL